MATKPGNLADPAYEPSDDELQELASEAFADVPRRNAEALQKVHAEITKMRLELRQKYGLGLGAKCLK